MFPVFLRKRTSDLRIYEHRRKLGPLNGPTRHARSHQERNLASPAVHHRTTLLLRYGLHAAPGALPNRPPAWGGRRIPPVPPRAATWRAGALLTSEWVTVTGQPLILRERAAQMFGRMAKSCWLGPTAAPPKQVQMRSAL